MRLMATVLHAFAWIYHVMWADRHRAKAEKHLHIVDRHLGRASEHELLAELYEPVVVDAPTQHFQ